MIGPDTALARCQDLIQLARKMGADEADAVAPGQEGVPERVQEIFERKGNAGSDADPCHHQWHCHRKDHRPCKRGDGDKPAQGLAGFRRLQNHSALASLAGLLLSSGV